MSYAARADMEARFGAEEIADLARDDQFRAPDSEGARDDPGRIESALADAAAEIDAALASLYIVPLGPGPWPRLVPIACDIARARLYDDRESETVSNRKRAARAELKRLADDMGGLLDSAGRPAPKRETARAARKGPAPVMTADNLAGL